nr:hypothetical protein [Tanacetum cinerariifolium]GEV95277.1 hypothetical protein [Tanacetum cinerariifolium]
DIISRTVITFRIPSSFVIVIVVVIGSCGCCYWVLERSQLVQLYPIERCLLPITLIEDAFSSTHSPDYTPASSGYFPALPGNTSPDPSDNLSKYLLASLAISPFHNDPYMKVIHAYDAIIPPQVPIPPPIIVPPSLMLFNPQEFFVLEELLPPKEQVSYLTSSSTDLSNTS